MQVLNMHVEHSVHSGLEKPHGVDIFTSMHVKTNQNQHLPLLQMILCDFCIIQSTFLHKVKIQYLHVKSMLIMITTMTLDTNQHA